MNHRYNQRKRNNSIIVFIEHNIKCYLYFQTKKRMDPFLKQVAKYLYNEYDQGLKDVCIVFPSRRASVFFNAYLNEIIDKAIIGPETTTITQLIGEVSEIQQANQVHLILKLQQIFNEVTGYNETLDEFYFWGEILISDFDDIDKYLLNANNLFTNISDLKELESKFDYLNEKQILAIEHFWGSLGKVEDSINKEKFIALWNKLPQIYKRFNQELKTEQIAYSGLIYRELAENTELLTSKKTDFEKFIFVGFNALNNCEKTIFKRLQDAEKAMFFWDFDQSYLDDTDNEAGYFLRSNLVKFPAPSNFMLENGHQKKIKK